MDDQQFFDLAFISVLSMQFHPRNRVDNIDKTVDYAATVALNALILRNETQLPNEED